VRVQRPSLRGVVGIFGVIAALQVFNLVTHDDVLTAVVTFLICGGYVGLVLLEPALPLRCAKRARLPSRDDSLSPAGRGFGSGA